MVNLTIYGKPSSTYEYIKQIVLSTAQKAKIELDLNEVRDIQQFINKDIMSIPAYQFNGQVYEKGDNTLSQFVRELQIELLKKGEYGDLRVINVPTDFSESSSNAINYASQLSQEFNSILKLIHIYHPSPVQINQGYSLPELYDIKFQYLTSYANMFFMDNLEFSKHIIELDLKVGLAYDEILKISEEDNRNWIVMASSDSSKTIKNIFGSISISTAKNSSCPVFIIPPEVEFMPYKKIAMCINQDEIDAVSELWQIATPFDAEIHLLNVFDPHEKFDRETMGHDLAALYPENRVKLFTLTGKNKIETINDYCLRSEIDLLVLTTHKRGILDGLFHKSFTKQILLNTQLPILILNN